MWQWLKDLKSLISWWRWQQSTLRRSTRWQARTHPCAQCHNFIADTVRFCPVCGTLQQAQPTVLLPETEAIRIPSKPGQKKLTDSTNLLEAINLSGNPKATREALRRARFGNERLITAYNHVIYEQKRGPVRQRLPNPSSNQAYRRV